MIVWNVVPPTVIYIKIPTVAYTFIMMTKFISRTSLCANLELTQTAQLTWNVIAGASIKSKWAYLDILVDIRGIVRRKEESRGGQKRIYQAVINIIWQFGTHALYRSQFTTLAWHKIEPLEAMSFHNRYFFGTRIASNDWWWSFRLQGRTQDFPPYYVDYLRALDFQFRLEFIRERRGRE